MGAIRKISTTRTSTMRLINCAIVTSLVLLSNARCQLFEDDYANAECVYEQLGEVCNCKYSQNIMRLPKLHGNARRVHVKNCETFHVPADSLADLHQVNGLIFENIGNLMFSEYSFISKREQPTIRFEITNSTVPNIPSHVFKGNLEEVLIRDCNISKISVFAFTGLFGNIFKIRIQNSIIGGIESHAFKKLTIRNLEIIDTMFQMNFMSRTFYDCHIENVVIEGSIFTMLHASTFDLKEVHRLRILNSTFGVIEGEAFMMDVSDRAIFSNNSVTMLHHGAFRGIIMNERTPTQRTQEVFFEFNNNHVNFIDPELDVSFCPNMKLQVSKFYLRDPRDCDALNRISENKFFSENANSVFMRIREKDENFDSISYLSDRCRSNSNFLMILMIILACTLLLIIVIVVVLWFYCRRRKHLDIIMPEPRTYRQTQIVMRLEEHGLIKTDF